MPVFECGTVWSPLAEGPFFNGTMVPRIQLAILTTSKSIRSASESPCSACLTPYTQTCPACLPVLLCLLYVVLLFRMLAALRPPCLLATLLLALGAASNATKCLHHRLLVGCHFRKGPSKEPTIEGVLEAAYLWLSDKG